MGDLRNYLEFGLAPHSPTRAAWDALEMTERDHGRVWGPWVPETLPTVWTRNLWGPAYIGAERLALYPQGDTVIFLNESNLPYEPLKESAQLEPEYAAALFVYMRQIRPDLRWLAPAINGVDAWDTSQDGLPFPWFRQWIAAVFSMLKVVERFGMERPFEAVDGWILNWYSHPPAPIPEAWRSPAWAAETLLEMAETAGISRVRPVIFGEISARNDAATTERWLDEMYASPHVQRAYWFTPFDERKPQLSMLTADSRLKATGRAFVDAKRRLSQ